MNSDTDHHQLMYGKKSMKLDTIVELILTHIVHNSPKIKFKSADSTDTLFNQNSGVVHYFLKQSVCVQWINLPPALCTEVVQRTCFSANF